MGDKANFLGDCNNQYEIGGRATDISQIAIALEQRLEAMFPVNEAPEDLVLELKILKKSLVLGEALIYTFLMNFENRVADG